MRALTVISIVALFAGVAMFFGADYMVGGMSIEAEAVSWGDTGFDPTFKFVSPGQQCTNEIQMYTLGRDPGAFTLEVTYDESVVMAVDWSSPHQNVIVNMLVPGEVRITGFDVGGFGMSQNLSIVQLKWLAISPGAANLNLTVETLADTNGVEIGGQGRSGAVVVE